MFVKSSDLCARFVEILTARKVMLIATLVLFLLAGATAFANTIYFAGYDSYGRTMWISCGSSAGSYGYVCDDVHNQCYVSEALTEEAPSVCGSMLLTQ